MNEERLMRPVPEETTLRVLQAVVEEAHGRAGVYVTRDRVMQRVNMEDSEHFKAIAEHLEQRGWIAAAGVDYLAFVVTICGHAKVVSRARPFRVAHSPRLIPPCAGSYGLMPPLFLPGAG